jgi:hypothetical protein
MSILRMYIPWRYGCPFLLVVVIHCRFRLVSIRALPLTWRLSHRGYIETSLEIESNAKNTIAVSLLKRELRKILVRDSN